jgi:hypothetical protein
VLPVWMLARRIAGVRVARLACLLVAIHPFLVAMSDAVLSESVYLLLLMTGCAWGLRAIEEDDRWAPIVSGAAFGLAYLTRPEGLLFALLGLGLLFAALLRRRWVPVRRSLLFLGSFAVVGAPYVIWLYGVTGGIHLETKSADNFEYARRVAAGVPPAQALHGIEDDLTETGLSVRPSVVTLRTVRASPGESVRFYLQSARLNGPRLFHELTSDMVLGGAILFALAVLGWFADPWDLPRLYRETFVLVLLGALVAPLLTLQHFSPRFGLPFLTLLLVPTARGWDQTGRWAQATGASLRWRAARYALLALQPLLLLGMVVASLHGLPDVEDLQVPDPEERVVATWIRQHSRGHERIVDSAPIVAYYAGAAFSPFPYARPETALRYMKHMRVGFVILRSGTEPAPYAEDWLVHGVPDPDATLAYRAPATGGGDIVVYRFGAETSPGQR